MTRLPKWAKQQVFKLRSFADACAFADEGMGHALASAPSASDDIARFFFVFGDFRIDFAFAHEYY